MSGRKEILIVGMGASGLAAADLAVKDGMELRLTDRRGPDELAGVVDSLPSGCRTFLGSDRFDSLEGVSLVVISPGVPVDNPLVCEARQREIEVLSELEFAWRHRRDAPLVAVTGSNGKSTVTTLVAEMLNHSGISTAAGGNLGPPASRLVLDGSWDAWVLEVSSFQAEAFVDFRPDVGVFLNLSQDHLERHRVFDDYLSAKLRLFSRQDSDDTAVLNADDPRVAEVAVRSRRLYFSTEKTADGWLDGDRLIIDGEEIIRRSDIRITGIHNVANALAAGLAALKLGASPDAVAAALRDFEGLPHRHRLVCTSGGVTWIDDSKATNVGSTRAAISGYPPGSVHLILGGMAKNQDFSSLRDVVEEHVSTIYLIGRDAGLIGKALEGCAEIEECGCLEQAVRSARGNARSGQSVVLAPGCASFDQFSGYPERGEKFAELARREGCS